MTERDQTCPDPAHRPINCWEFMRCGRQPGGERVAEMGVCPAAVESRLDGVLGGTNAGRSCWVVAGTFCKGEPAGTFVRRYASCAQCEFFRRVEAEERPFFRHAEALLLYLSASETAEGDRYHRVLDHMVDPAVLRYALGHLDGKRTGEERHVTAVFTDLTGFSEVSGKLAAADLAALLNEYLSAMTWILKAEGGTLDKYIGDAIVGIFGAPMALENDALAAARTALRMQERLATLRDEWRARNAWTPRAWSLEMRIGLSSGLAKVGFMGTSHFASYTMTGATVNLAKWLERTCKVYGTPILVSEATRDLIAGEMVLRRIDTVRPKGRVGTEAIYQLLGRRDDTPPDVVRAAEIYESALTLSEHGRKDTAAILLCRQDAPRDRAARRLLRRCKRRRPAR